MSLQEFRRHQTHFAPSWEHMSSAFNECVGQYNETGADAWEHCRRMMNPLRDNLEPWNRLDCPAFHSFATDEVLAMLGKAREDVEVVPIRPVGARLGAFLRCFTNCTRLACAQPYRYVPVIGWMLWVSQAGGAVAESHCVVRDCQSGELQCITEPLFPETDTHIWFVPDWRTKPKGTRLVSQHQMWVYASYGCPGLADERDHDEKRPVEMGER